MGESLVADLRAIDALVGVPLAWLLARTLYEHVKNRRDGNGQPLRERMGAMERELTAVRNRTQDLATALGANGTRVAVVEARLEGVMTGIHRLEEAITRLHDKLDRLAERP